MAELEACPWCGGKAQTCIYPMGERLLRCGRCHATPFEKAARTDEEFAAMWEAWNRRTPDYRALAQTLAAALVNVIAMAAKYYLPGTMDAAIDDCRAALDAAGVEHA